MKKVHGHSLLRLSRGTNAAELLFCSAKVRPIPHPCLLERRGRVVHKGIHPAHLIAWVRVRVPLKPFTLLTRCRTHTHTHTHVHTHTGGGFRREVQKVMRRLVGKRRLVCTHAHGAQGGRGAGGGGSRHPRRPWAIQGGIIGAASAVVDSHPPQCMAKQRTNTFWKLWFQRGNWDDRNHGFEGMRWWQ